MGIYSWNSGKEYRGDKDAYEAKLGRKIAWEFSLNSGGNLSVAFWGCGREPIPKP